MNGIHCAQFCDSYLPLYDGVTIAVDAYARILNEQGDTCCVVAPHYPRYSENGDLPVYRFPSLPVPGYAPYRFGLPMLSARPKRALEACPLNIIHAHSPFTAGHAALRLARRRSIPIVATFHTKYYNDFLDAVHLKPIARGMTNAIIRFYNQVDDVWTVNGATAQTLREYGYTGGIRIIPNGSDLNVTGDMGGMRARAEAMLKIDPGTPLLLFVGRHERQKNPHLLIEALALLKPGTRYHLAMAGNGRAAAELKALVARHDLERHVTFLGEVGDRDALCALYSRACLFILPSVYDNAPVVVQEAAACGCPPLLIRGSNAADGVLDGQNGLLCQLDPASIAQAVSAALADPALTARIGEAAHATLAVSWRDVVAQVREAYVSVMNNASGRHFSS